jgi:hypothetical protein
MADVKYRRIGCADCGSPIWVGSVRCGPCSRTHNGALRRAASRSTFVCETCFRPSYRGLGGMHLSGGYKNRWCSMACRVIAATRLRDEIESLRKIRRNNLAQSPPRGWLEAYREKNAHIWAAPRTCALCASTFVKPWGKSASRIYCSDGCRQEAALSAKRAAKAKRRALTARCVAESIDPMRVFERDGWRCHLCGRPTPARLRGTNDDRAPELDHLLPLAIGGAHTWANVACSCRACNGAKGARPLGQLMIEAFANAGAPR